VVLLLDTGSTRARHRLRPRHSAGHSEADDCEQCDEAQRLSKSCRSRNDREQDRDSSDRERSDRGARIGCHGVVADEAYVVGPRPNGAQPSASFLSSTLRCCTRSSIEAATHERRIQPMPAARVPPDEWYQPRTLVVAERVL
jgi:hypothetical protein